MATTPPPVPAAAHPVRPGNLAPLLSWRRRLGLGLLAAAAGVLAAAPFPPLEWSWSAWLVLVPLLWLGMAQPRRAWGRGFLFGYGCFVASLFWLRTIFWFVPWLLALICACFPMLWVGLAAALEHWLRRPPALELLPQAGPRPLPPPPLGPRHQVLLVLLLPALWVALEWVRSWLFTGFPWNFLGVSQWANGYLTPLTRYTGVYGISYVIATVNVALWLYLRQWRPWPGQAPAARSIWPAVAALAVVALPWLAHGRYPLPEPRATMRIAAVQGNIPQIRVPRPGQLEEAREVYLRLTREIVATAQPELVVWPETALPVPVLLDETTAQELRALLLATRTPMVVGTLDYRAPGANAAPGDYLSFNSAMHIVPTPQVQVVEVYDKMHPVPFGEYVPFERTFPVLSNLFGMGRGLTAGRRYSIFGVRQDVRLGPLICFEDVFPEQARGMVLRGANVLLTITNDAWYWETSGSRQHLLNSVLRAVETCRPLVRSGNNSDTCLVLPDGSIVDPLLDPATGSPFARRAGVFTVPVYDRLPTTFYTLYGNLFAVLCALAAAAAAGWCLLRALGRRQRLARAIQPDG